MYIISQSREQRKHCWTRSSLTVYTIKDKHQFLFVILKQSLQAHHQSVKTVDSIILL
jgi:hypothetical protein